jgi:ATP-dependent Lon protease
MKIIIPAINSKNQVKYFEVQCHVFNDGKGECIVTGLVDDSINEVVQVSMTLIKKNLEFLNIDYDSAFNSDIHIHFTDGSFYKEGTSSGIGIFLALVCQLAKKNLKYNIIASGEIDLNGNVYEVGGIEYKFDNYNSNDEYLYFYPEKNKTKELNSKKNTYAINNVFELINFINDVEGKNEIIDF